MEEWQKRYRRAMLDFIGAPEDVDLEKVIINTYWDEGYYYSSRTFEDPSMKMDISYVRASDERYPDDYFMPKYAGTVMNSAGSTAYHTLYTNDVVKLIQSFG